MMAESSTTTPVQRRRWVRVLGWLIGVIAVVIAGMLIAAPYVIRQQTVDWLQHNGADRAQLDDVHLNVFAGTFGLDNLTVQRHGDTPLHVRELRVDLDWSALFDKRIVVDTMWLYGAQLTVAVDNDKHLTLGGITLPTAAPETSAPTPPTTGRSDWTVGANVVVLADSSVRLRIPDLDQTIALNTIYLLDARGWDAQHTARVGALVAMNGRALWLGSDVRPFANAPDASSDIEVRNLDLSVFRDLAAVAGVNELAGKLSLKLSAQTVYDPTTAAHAVVRGDIALDDFRIDYGPTRATQGALRYSGEIDAQLAKGAAAPRIRINGTLESREQTLQSGTTLVQHAQLAWQGNVALRPDTGGGMSVEAHGKIDGTAIDIDDQQAQLRTAHVGSLAIDDVALQLPARVDVGAVRVQQGVLFEPTGTAATNLPRVAFDTLALTGVGYDLQAKSARVGDVAIAALQARDSAKKLTLATAEALAVKGIDVALDERASVSEVSVHALRALTADSPAKTPLPPVVVVGDLAVNDVAYRFVTPRLTIEQVAMTDMVADVSRDKNGVMRGISQLVSTGATTSAASTETPSVAGQPASDAEPLSLRLGRFVLRGKSAVKWSDQAVTPAAKLTMSSLAITTGAIDTATPDARSTIELFGALQPSNELRVSGDAAPLAAKPSAALTGKIKQLDLTPFGPYANAAGYTLRSGRLDADIDAKVDQGQLDVLNKLVITKLQLESADGQRGATEGATAMPLNVALGYLRDDNDRIKLDLPIKGDVRDPKFEFGDVVRLATQAAAEQAAMTYLTTALQPLGTVLLVGKLAKGAMNALQLQPVVYAPGESALDTTATDYAEKIAGILKSRPGVNLTVCGSATEGDRDTLRARAMAATATEKTPTPPTTGANTNAPVPAAPPVLPEISDDELLELALARSNGFRDVLVQRFGVKSEQLFDCRPVIERDTDAKPQVTLGM